MFLCWEFWEFWEILEGGGFYTKMKIDPCLPVDPCLLPEQPRHEFHHGPDLPAQLACGWISPWRQPSWKGNFTIFLEGWFHHLPGRMISPPSWKGYFIIFLEGGLHNIWKLVHSRRFWMDSIPTEGQTNHHSIVNWCIREVEWKNWYEKLYQLESNFLSMSGSF